MSQKPTVRQLTLAQVETLVDWAAGEGWNPGLHDAAAFRAADPDGFLGAFVDNEMASGISAVAYGANFGFIGLYICRQDMRGKGLGKAVWDAGMARLGTRTVGLDGVPAQQPNYRSIGFVPAYRTIRYSGRMQASPSETSVSPIEACDLDMVAAFDRTFFPAARAVFIGQWVAPPHIALMERQGGAVVGYGVARACREGFKVGPLFATDMAVASRLLSALSLRCDGVLHIDVPETQARFAHFLAANSFVSGFECTRMYRGEMPRVDLDGVFGVTSFELG